MSKQDSVNHKNGQLKIRRFRYFSEEFKRQKVRELDRKEITIAQVVSLYQVSRTSVYKWIYKYSPHHQQQGKLVVEMESEAQRTRALLERVRELEQIVGQKQLEIDYLNKLVELGSGELNIDLKKNFGRVLSSGSGNVSGNTTGK